MSPTGRRAAFEARGDIVTVPAEHGAVINVTRISGVADRYPRWSPDGKTIAYWSDRSGEYELTLRPAEAPGAERKVTSLGPGFRYPPQWAPDSKKIAFIDQAMRIRVYDDATGKIDRGGQESRLDRARRARGVPLPMVARLALARPTRAPAGTEQQRNLPVRHQGRGAAAGDEPAT